MNYDALNAALVLETLNDHDRQWVLAHLSEQAVERLKVAQTELEQQNINELVDQMVIEESPVNTNSDNHNELLVHAEKIMALLKQEPHWMRNCVLGVFDVEGQAKLSCGQNIMIKPLYLTPKLSQIVLESLNELILLDGDSNEADS